MTQTTLYFFGQPQIIQDNRPVDIRARKALALLAYLSVTQKAHSRDALAGLLWPEYDQTRARTNLRRVLYQLNKTRIGTWIESKQESIYLNLPAEATVDVLQFEEFKANNQLEEAVSVYTSDFLIGFYLPDSAPFDEWATMQRQHLRLSLQDVLKTLANIALSQGNGTAATGYARRRLEMDNLDESAWQQLMRGLVFQGQRAAALVAYEQCQAILHEELDVDPSIETTTLAKEIRQQAGPQSTETTTESSPTPISEKESLLTFPPDVKSPIAKRHESALIPSPPPYRGLMAFREADAPFFFGREAFTDLLVVTAEEQSVVAVIGPSGSGKSSVVYAGLIAQIRNNPIWVVASFRPGDRPFHALAAAFIPLLENDLSETERLIETNKLASAWQDQKISLRDVVQRILQKQSQTKRLLLAADQFEELYTLCPDANLRHNFLDMLLSLVFEQQYRSEPTFTLIITLRADFLGQALAHRPVADAIQESDVKLGPMSRPELSRAISAPARKVGVEFEAGLVNRILDDVGSEPGNLPLLQFALTAMWEQRANGLLTHAIYDEIGRVGGALARYADDVYADLEPELQADTRRIFIQLVQPGEGTEDTRRLTTRAELGEALWPTVSRLADARLVVVGRDPAGKETVEVAHEALIAGWEKLQNWMVADRDFRVWQERLRFAMRSWESVGRDKGGLLRGVALATAEEWLLTRPADLSKAEQAYITSSLDLKQERERAIRAAQKERERLQRRAIYLLGGGLVATIVFALLAGVGWLRAAQEQEAAETAQNEAAKQALIAESRLSRQLASEALAATDLDLGLLLAVEALKVQNTPEANRVIQMLLHQNPRLQRLISGHEGPVLALTVSADGSRVVSGDGEGNVLLWDGEMNLLPGRLPSPRNGLLPSARGASIRALAFHPDGDRLAVGRTGSVYVWDVSTEGIDSAREISGTHLDSGLIRGVGYSPVGNWLLVAKNNGKLFILPEEGGQPVTEFSAEQPLSTLAISQDGKTIAIGGLQGYLQLLRLTESGSVSPIGPPLTGHVGLIQALAFDPAGNTLLSSSNEGTQEGNDLISTSAVGTLVAYTLSDTPEEKFSISLETNIHALAISPDGEFIAGGGRDNLVHLWKVEDGSPAGEPLAGHSSNLTKLAFLTDGRLLSGANRPTMFLWQLDIENSFSLQFQAHDSSVEQIAYSPEGNIMASASGDGELRTWMVNSDGYVSPFGQPFLVSINEEVGGIALSKEARYLLAGLCVVENFCASGRISAWSLVEDGSLDHEGEFTFTADTNDPSKEVTSGAFSADGRLFAGGHFNGEVKLWATDPNADDFGQLLWTAAAGELPVFGLSFSGDGKTIAAGGCLEGNSNFMRCDQGGTWLLEAESGNQIREPFTGTLGVNVAALNQDGSLVSAAYDAHSPLIWWLPGGESIELSSDAETNSEPIGLYFDLQDRWLLSADSNDIIATGLNDNKTWFALNSAPLNQFRTMAYRPDGLQFAVGFNEGQIGFINVGVDELTAQACRRAGRDLTEAEWQRYFGGEPYRPVCFSE